MKHLPLFVVLLLTIAAGLTALGEGESLPPAGGRVITDMAGREVILPGEIHSVMGKSPMGTILIYTLDPDSLAGWNYLFTEQERRYIPSPYDELPLLGGWFGKKNSANLEKIIKTAPDIIMDADFLTPETIAADDELQNQLGIPVVMVDGSGMDALPGVYRFMGELLGLGTRAEELAAYCEDTLDTARSITSVMDDSRRISVYYAEGPEGLQTEPRGSRHTQLIPLCGGINAADGGKDASVDMARVSLEQVILWNPQVIITPAEGGGGEAFLTNLSSLPGWSEVEAVREGRLYAIPQYPFGWFDRPASVNRIVGIGWLSRILHADLFPTGMEEEVCRFYSLFYHLDLNGAQLDELLAGR